MLRYQVTYKYLFKGKTSEKLVAPRVRSKGRGGGVLKLLFYWYVNNPFIDFFSYINCQFFIWSFFFHFIFDFVSILFPNSKLCRWKWFIVLGYQTMYHFLKLMQAVALNIFKKDFWVKKESQIKFLYKKVWIKEDPQCRTGVIFLHKILPKKEPMV